MSRLTRARLILGVLALGATACRGPEQPGPLDPRPVRTIERWLAESGGDRVGEVHLMQIDDPAGEVRFYRAVNASGQWLGYVDEWGRVFQRRPFAEREVFVGTYPMDEGLALLYERDAPVQLVPPDEAEAQEAAHEKPAEEPTPTRGDEK